MSDEDSARPLQADAPSDVSAPDATPASPADLCAAEDVSRSGDPADAANPADAEPAKPSRDWFFVVLVVLAILKAAMSRALGLGAASLPMAVVLESAAVLAVLGVVDVIWHRRSYTLDLIAYSVLSVVMLANVIYASYMGQIFSPALLSVVGQATDVSASIESLLKPIYLLYLLDIPVLVGWALTVRVSNQTPPRKRSWLVLATTVLAVIVVSVQIGFVLGLSADVDSAAVARARGFGVYQIGSLVRLAMPDPAAATVTAIEHPKNVSPGRALQEQIDAIRHGDIGARIGDIKTGQYKGKNVIVIQVEALQDLVINSSYHGKMISPNLNKLVTQSWYFPNTFSETSAGNTVDAEFTADTGLLAPVNGAASVEYSNRVLPGLPRLLRAYGYDAITFHQNDVRFWNRIELYPALGFRRYWDRSYFMNRDKMWHASDQILFSMGMNILKSEEASSVPFYAHIVTESSHTPFIAIPMDRRPLRLSASDEKTLSGKYIGSISYTDMAMGEFFAALKKSGMWDDSIVVIYGDHSAILDGGVNKGDSAIADQILGRPYSAIDHQRIPLIIHLPGQTEGHTSTKPDGQVDIMPTIADLVGMDTSDTPHVGRSVFVDAPSFIPTRAYLPAGSFINDSVLFMPGLSFEDGSAVSVATAQKVAPTETEQRGLELAQRLSLLSDAWVKSLPIRPDAHGTANAVLP
ncbi:MAG: LTA synthase family protein [Coriobacteriia bacterium]|nr:LTA synthase family protein [Coriobacteriia bacterium]